MDFSVGDKVLYANRGAGTIIGVEHEELVDGFEDYYYNVTSTDRCGILLSDHKSGRWKGGDVQARDFLLL